MGCCGSRSTFGIPPETIKGAVIDLREKYGSDLLVMSIKDQNVPGKLCLSGNADAELVTAITACLLSDEQNKDVQLENDEYDHMWEYTWRNTQLTTGHSTFSLQKNYFPRGRIIVQLLDTLANFGWALTACPNMGGVESRDDTGNVISAVDWPVFVFYKEPQSKFTATHLLLAVKDSNIPGKLCAAGPVGEMEGEMAKKLAEFADGVKSEKDSYDSDFDVVWRNTSITTGMNALSLGKSYFPKGKTNISLLQCAYSFGWRTVAAPNFGGQDDSWPCYILRKLKDASAAAPELCIGAIKDSNIPGKFCFSGPSANSVVEALCGALRELPQNADVNNEKDSYDTDHDAVARNVNITSGTVSSFFGLEYFPRGDAMKTVLETWAQQGWQVACCPNFGGMSDSWPTFVLEKRNSPVGEQMFLAVKDDNIPGKVDVVGGASVDPTLGEDLLHVFQTLCGPDVTIAQDDYDETYSLAFRNTRLTTGNATFTFQKPYWPHGYVLEMMLQVFLKRGWKAQGGPNFGDGGNTWPGIVFTRET